MADTSMNLAGLMTAANQQMSTIDSTVAQMKVNNAGMADASSAIADAVSRGTDANGDTPLSIQTRKLGQLEAQNQKAIFHSAIGEDGEGNAKLSSFLAEQFQATTRKAVEQASDIQDRESVGLLDDPLAYIWNQLILPDAKNQLAATLKKSDTIKDGMNELNTALEAHARVEDSYAKTMTAASVESQALGAQANLDIRVQAAKREAYQLDSQNMATIMAASGQKIGLIHQVFMARNADAHLALAQETASREREKFKQWQTDQQDTEDYIATTTELANSQARAMGKPEFTRKQVALAMKGKAQPGLSATIQQYAEAGFINKNSDALGNRYGETPSAAATFTTATNTPVPPAVLEVYQQASEAANGEAKLKNMDVKNKVVMDNLLNQKVKQLLDSKVVNIDPRDGTNPYVVPDMKVLAQAASVQETALYKEVLAPQVAAGGLISSDPKVLIAKGLDAVDHGKLSLQELAANIQTIYLVGIHANNVEKQFGRFGMPEQTGYQVKGIEPGGILSSKPPVPADLTKIDDINRILIKMRAAEAVGANPLGI